jgi:hypothetical protein
MYNFVWVLGDEKNDQNALAGKATMAVSPRQLVVKSASSSIVARGPKLSWAVVILYPNVGSAARPP